MATRIYVGNLPYTADNEGLAQLFGAFGEVLEAAVIMDRETGRSKGFGFVQMANESEAHNAIASLNGTMFGNRTIRVNEAQPRPERTGGYGRGGGYGRDNYGGGRESYGGGRESYGGGRESYGNRGGGGYYGGDDGGDRGYRAHSQGDGSRDRGRRDYW